MQWSNYLDQEGYSQGSKALYKTLIKRFYAWLYKSKDGEYPEVVSWIKAGRRRGNNLRDKILSEDEIYKLIQAADNYRDKALIAVLYESACRVSELLTLRLKHVRFDKYGASILVSGKTGERPIRLINSVPYLQKWLNVHPAKDNLEAPVFSRARGDIFRPLSKREVYGLVGKLSKRARIEKKVHPHMLRHSRLTELASKLKEPELRLFAGWTNSSDMPAIYVHLSARDVDEAIRRIAGILEPEEKKPEPSKLEPKKCPRCEAMNPADFKFCGKCGMALDLQAAMDQARELEDLKAKVKELEEIKEVLAILAKGLKVEK
jgi:integrase